MKLSRGGLILSGVYVVFFAVVYSLTFIYDHKTGYFFLMLSVFPAVLVKLLLYWLSPSALDRLDNFFHCDSSLCEAVMGYGTLVAYFTVSLGMAYLTGWVLEKFIVLMSTPPRTTGSRR